jgi:hypothetical protein
MASVGGSVGLKERQDLCVPRLLRTHLFSHFMHFVLVFSTEYKGIHH